jgi:hypothetical protein
LDRLLGHCFPDVALIKLGVTDEGDKAVRGDSAEALPGVASGERGEDGGNRTQADRASGKVDRVRILGARWVGLETAEFPQRAQVGAIETTKQILRGVKDRGRVGLDGDAVARA